MQLIGLSGYARSGKDEAAKVLVEEYGFKRIAFADKLRDFLYALNPIIGSDVDPYEFWTVKQAIDYYGWDGYKATEWGRDIRSLLQRLGTEAGRNTLWDSIWIDAALHDLDEQGRYVVTDARFPNEADAIVSRGGIIARITRSGVGPANQHASETSLDDYPFTDRLNNDSTLADFQESVRAWYTDKELG